MSAEPRFSVVVPAYNEEELVAGALESLRRQTVSDWEALVVDDGSSDGTGAVVERIAATDPRVRLIHQPNQGLSAARNTGIAAASAELVSFLDSDDLFLPRYLELMGGALEADPGAGFAYTDAWALDTERGRFRRATALARNHPPRSPPADPHEFSKLLLHANFIFVSTTVRREVLEEAGPFDVTLKSSEDYDMWLRILANGHRAVRADGVLAIKRDRPTAMSNNLTRMLETMEEVFERVERESPDEDLRALAAKRLRETERWRQGLAGESSFAAWIAVRRVLGKIRRGLLRPWYWRARPPAEVRQAFPDLERL